MKVIDLLKIKWMFWGLDAPAFTWIVAAGLLVFTIFTLVWLFGKVYKQKNIYKNAKKKIDELKKKSTTNINQGLEGAIYEELREFFEKNKALKDAWYQLDSEIVVTTDSDSNNFFWSPESAETAFSDSLVIDTKINRAFYNSFSGILTGIGLLTTFLAILVALLDVKLVNSQVQGLELLIQGLSGKFISSIAALLAATVYTLIEKPLLHNLVKSRKGLVQAIDKLLPRLTTARMMASMRNEMAEQTNAIKNFNTRLAPILKTTFTESMGPTIDRMADAIDDLNKLLRANESQKQESISGTIEHLLTNLQLSMTNSLEKMSATFSEALSGTAKDQFDNVATSLRDSTLLLESMNSQFNNMQSSLKGLISFAESSTKAQIAVGKNQVEDLTKALKDLMAQMNESTDKSVNKMNSFIVSTIANLSEKMTNLNEQMMVNIESSAKRSDEVANGVMKQAHVLSAQNSEQIKRIMEKHEELLAKTQGVRQALDISLKNFKEAVTECSAIYKNMNDFSSQMNTIMANISSSSQSMKSSQETLSQISSSTKNQIEKMSQINREQEAVWMQIKKSMEAYPSIFKNVENTAAQLLGEIAKHLEDYTKVSNQNFNNLVKVSDEHFANATKRLGSAVNDLQEYLQDLTEVLEKLRQPNNIRK